MIIRFLTSGSTKNYFDEIFYKSERYCAYVKDILINESQIEKKDYIHSLFTQLKGKHILGRGIKLACTINRNPIFINNDLNDFIKKINYEKCDYLFCTPSFLWNFKDILNLDKIKKIQFSGEYISPKLKDYFLNELSKKLLINHYGSSETFGIGYGLLKDDFKIIKNAKIINKNKIFYFESPYTRNNNQEKLSDILELNENQFKILGRNNLNFIKKNGRKINLLKLKKFLFDLNLIDVSFEISNDLFENFNLHVITNLNEKQIRDEIYLNFNNEYQPKEIFFYDKYIKSKNNIKFKLF